MLQRKSRRLVARAVKEAEAKRFEDEHALHMDEDGAKLASAECLLQRCRDYEIALITQQVSLAPTNTALNSKTSSEAQCLALHSCSRGRHLEKQQQYRFQIPRALIETACLSTE